MPFPVITGTALVPIAGDTVEASAAEVDQPDGIPDSRSLHGVELRERVVTAALEVFRNEMRIHREARVRQALSDVHADDRDARGVMRAMYETMDAQPPG